MWIRSTDFEPWGLLPDWAAYRNLDAAGRLIEGANVNPGLVWGDVPVGTKSLALYCVDDDVPLMFEKRIGVHAPRRRFVHGLLIDCPPEARNLSPGLWRPGLVPFGRCGVNDYVEPGEEPLAGEPGRGYDGPWPPTGDERWHAYRFQVLALNVPRLDLPDYFSGVDFEEALQGAVLAGAEIVGRYSLNSIMKRAAARIRYKRSDSCTQ